MTVTPWNPPPQDGEEPTLIEHAAAEPNRQVHDERVHTYTIARHQGTEVLVGGQ